MKLGQLLLKIIATPLGWLGIKLLKNPKTPDYFRVGGDFHYWPKSKKQLTVRLINPGWNPTYNTGEPAIHSVLWEGKHEEEMLNHIEDLNEHLWNLALTEGKKELVVVGQEIQADIDIIWTPSVYVNGKKTKLMGNTGFWIRTADNDLNKGAIGRVVIQIRDTRIGPHELRHGLGVGHSDGDYDMMSEDVDINKVKTPTPRDTATLRKVLINAK